MIAHVKYLPHILVLAGGLTLAGCGSSNPTPDPAACPEGQSRIGEGDCKTPEQHRQDGVTEGTATGRAEAQQAADATANQAKYQALQKALNGYSFPNSFPSNADGKDDSDKASVMLKGETFKEKYGSGSAGIVSAYDAGTITFDTGSGSKLVKAAAFATVGEEEHKLSAGSFRTPGTFDGVSGTFFCTAGCKSVAVSGGSIDLEGTWKFTGTESAQVTIPDAVSYGWWVETNTDGTVKDAGLFREFSNTPPFGVSDYAGGGSAIYKGDALGKYVASDDDFGHFTAKAELTATFGAMDKLKGEIDTFVGADDKARSDWKVMLGEVSVATGQAYSSVMGDADNKIKAVWHIGDKKGEAGEWQGRLHGPSTPAAPTHASGEFFAHHGLIGRMIGAFGGKPE